MVRTQIYLTEDEQKALDALARETGQTKSELIRRAIDRFLERRAEAGRLDQLCRGRGIWAGRDDLPDLRAMRREWERFPVEGE
ncbi:MAG: CopG family transcriptional regulator [Thermodesulfobacteriota bacterium]